MKEDSMLLLNILNVIICILELQLEFVQIINFVLVLKKII